MHDEVIVKRSRSVLFTRRDFRAVTITFRTALIRRQMGVTAASSRVARSGVVIDQHHADSSSLSRDPDIHFFFSPVGEFHPQLVIFDFPRRLKRDVSLFKSAPNRNAPSAGRRGIKK